MQYSNVQLVVEEAGAETVFATRIATSKPRFDRETNRFVWDRFAAKVSGETTVPVDKERGLVHIPWPAKDEPAAENRECV